jgi:AmmeMemoRadiSam system protein A
MEKQNKEFLLKLARKAIEDKNFTITNKNLHEELKQLRGVFVTLTTEGELRGCIGNIIPTQPLDEGVVSLARAAAYEDPRFPPIEKEELKEIHIEVSLLSLPEKIIFSDENELVKRIKDKGVTIQKGQHFATFLPQVWEQLPKAEDFLGHLCIKAGLHPEDWKKGNLDIQTYVVEKFEE